MEIVRHTTIDQLKLCCSLLEEYVSYCDTEEAAIITHLKSEILTLQKYILQKEEKLDFDKLGDLQFPLCGENEGETLRYISNYFEHLHHNLISALPNENWKNEIEKLDFQQNQSGVKLISALLHNVLYLQEVVRRI